MALQGKLEVQRIDAFWARPPYLNILDCSEAAISFLLFESGKCRKTWKNVEKSEKHLQWKKG